MKRERGSALLLAAVGFVLMAGIGAALFSLSLAGQRATLAASNSDAAYHMAEAGVDDAINKMRAWLADPDPDADYGVIGEVAKDADGHSVNLVEAVLADGGYSVTIEPPFDGEGDYKITSRGEARGESRGIITWITAESESGVFKYGLFGDVYLDASGNIKTDGYDSSLGSYASQAKTKVGKDTVAGKSGHIGSNGALSVQGSSMVYGNATPGPGKTVTGGGAVHGSIAPAKSSMELPATNYAAPAGAASIAAISGTKTLGTGIYKVPSVSPSGKSVVTITGDVTLYVSGNVDFTGQASLKINAGATLTIYQTSPTSTLKVAGGSVFNTSQLPQSLKLYSEAKTVTFTGNSDFYGVVYAPKSEVKINGTSGVFGSVIGKTIDISGTPFFHYDSTLGGVKSDKVSFSVKAFEHFVP